MRHKKPIPRWLLALLLPLLYVVSLVPVDQLVQGRMIPPVVYRIYLPLAIAARPLRPLHKMPDCLFDVLCAETDWDEDVAAEDLRRAVEYGRPSRRWPRH